MRSRDRVTALGIPVGPRPPGCGAGSHHATATGAKSGAKIGERTKTVPETTEDDLGHWRNRWSVPDKHAHLARAQGALPLGDGTWLGYRRFPTSEEAERHARRYVAYNFSVFGIRYLGPEFFPDY